jgi:hypothetical protein
VYGGSIDREVAEGQGAMESAEEGGEERARGGGGEGYCLEVCISRDGGDWGRVAGEKDGADVVGISGT